MDKKIFIYFIFVVNLANGQNLINDLKGNWLCNQLLDSLGSKTTGKYGKSGLYLKFSFNKSNLVITQAPFDHGIKMGFALNKKDSVIDLFPNSIYPLPERKYKVKYLNNKFLALQTNNENGQKIFYIFTKQNALVKDSSLVDCGAILVKHLRLDKEGNKINRLSEYLINNTQELLSPTPYFDDYASSNFGDYFTWQFKFPKYYEMEKVSDELVIDFEVSKDGAKNISIVKGIDNKINEDVIRVIEKSSKKWKPVIINDKIFTNTIRLHMYFYLGMDEMLQIFKK